MIRTISGLSDSLPSLLLLLLQFERQSSRSLQFSSEPSQPSFFLHMCDATQRGRLGPCKLAFGTVNKPQRVAAPFYSSNNATLILQHLARSMILFTYVVLNVVRRLRDCQCCFNLNIDCDEIRSPWEANTSAMFNTEYLSGADNESVNNFKTRSVYLIIVTFPESESCTTLSHDHSKSSFSRSSLTLRLPRARNWLYKNRYLVSHTLDSTHLII